MCIRDRKNVLVVLHYFHHKPVSYTHLDVYKRQLYDKESSYYKNLKKSFIGNFFNKIFNHFKTKRIENFILNRIDYIVTETTENDYDVLIEYYPKLKIKPWREFCYYPIEMILGDSLLLKWAEGNNIQIGNSASVTNNHEYAMRFLSKLNLGERKIIVPIRYSCLLYTSSCV